MITRNFILSLKCTIESRFNDWMYSALIEKFSEQKKKPTLNNILLFNGKPKNYCFQENMSIIDIFIRKIIL